MVGSLVVVRPPSPLTTTVPIIEGGLSNLPCMVEQAKALYCEQLQYEELCFEKCLDTPFPRRSRVGLAAPQPSSVKSR